MAIVKQDRAKFDEYATIMQENTRSLLECANIKNEYNEKHNAFAEHYSQPNIEECTLIAKRGLESYQKRMQIIEKILCFANENNTFLESIEIPPRALLDRYEAEKRSVLESIEIIQNGLKTLAKNGFE